MIFSPRVIPQKPSRRIVAAAGILGVMMLAGCWTPTGRQEPVGVVKYGQMDGAGSAGIHTVLDGDTVYSVAKRYNLPLREVIAVNELNAPYKLAIGDRLKLPPPNEYQVRPHDTLNRISRMFDVSVSEVARLNHLSAPYTIDSGQVLRLPSSQPQLEQDFAANPPQPSFMSASAPGPGAVEREELPPVGTSGAATGATGSGQTQTASASSAGTGAGMPPRPSATAPAQATKAAATPQVAQKIPARSGSGRFMRPVDGQIISGYGPKDGGLHNDGINIRAARGTAVRAAENGVVAYAGSELQGYGNLILIRHADRWMTAYAHMDRVLVKKGDTVKSGQSIGTVGSTGQVDSPQLHFEVRRGTQALDPQLYL